MDDMAAALGNILNNPQTMQQIMSLASQLGLGGQGAAPEAGAAPPPDGAAAPQAPQQAPPAAAYPPPPGPYQGYPPPQAPYAAPPAYGYAPPPQPAAGLPNLLGNLDMNTISKFSQIMSGLNTRDANVDLLLALKPHFGEKRQKKVDDAIRIMQLVKMLPLLKETGIFGNLFGGGDT